MYLVQVHWLIRWISVWYVEFLLHRCVIITRAPRILKSRHSTLSSVSWQHVVCSLQNISAQVVYRGDTFGHYGLATPIYTHFTSPIRRYAGLNSKKLPVSLNIHS